MNKFRAPEEFKQEYLALMNVTSDKILDKIYLKRPKFNTNFLDEESDDENDGEDDGHNDSENASNVEGLATVIGEKFRAYVPLYFFTFFLLLVVL